MTNRYFSMKSVRLASCASTCLAGVLTALSSTAQVSFAPRVNYKSGGSAPLQTAVGDINRDGKLDIVAANYYGNTLGVLLGNGTGVFPSATTYSTGSNTMPFSVVLGDVNKDGLLDAVTSNETNTVSVLLGTTSGGFATARQYSTGYSAQLQHTTLGDVNKDGSLDIVAVNLDNTVAVLLNDKLGGFPSTPTLYNVGANTVPQELVLGDFNGDNSLDVVVTTLSNNNKPYDGVAIMLNNGSGVFSTPVIYSIGGSSIDPKFLVCGDLNGDNKLDLVTTNRGPATASVLLNNGNGGFAQAVIYNCREGAGDDINITLGDMNGDGKQDIIAVNYTRNLLRILLNDGRGVFTRTANTYATPMADQGPYSGTVADLNADGKFDVITSNYDSDNLTVFLNTSPAYLAADTKFNDVVFDPYPNPAQSSITLELPAIAGFAQGSIRLCDALGRIVIFEIVPLGKAHQVNLTNISSGVYSVYLQLGNSAIVRKLIVN